jgi:hypothetical protein
MISKPLVATEDVREHLPVRSGNDAFDRRIAMLINVATSQIETLTGRRFTRQEHTEFLKSVPTASLAYDFYSPTNEDGVTLVAREVRYILKGFPIDLDAPVELFYDPRRQFGEDTQVPESRYQIDAERGVMLLRLPTREYSSALKLSYSAGYEVDEETDSLTATIPGDIKLACVTQVMHMFNRLQSDNIGVENERGAKSVSSAKFLTRGGLTPEAAAMIAHYRQPLLGLS